MSNIKHQSPYGHVIIFPTELYYSLSDWELNQIEERYLNVNLQVINYTGSSVELDDIMGKKQNYQFPEEE